MKILQKRLEFLEEVYEIEYSEKAIEKIEETLDFLKYSLKYILANNSHSAREEHIYRDSEIRFREKETSDMMMIRRSNMKFCKLCGYPIKNFTSLPFGKKQCQCCGAVYTKEQLKK